MPKIRVLIVDDSVVIRRMIGGILERDAALEVVGAVAHGGLALQKIPQVNPDVVTMDVEMPEMDGIATVRAIRKIYPKLPVIMFSTLTAKGAVTTLEALAAGASDYVAKPANLGGITEGLQKLQEELIPKIKALCQAPPPLSLPRIPVPDSGLSQPACPPRPRAVPLGIVCMGTSTGGPNALAEVFRNFPADCPVPIVIVQHMPPLFTAFLAERLSASSAIKFTEGAEGEVLRPGRAYIAPGGKHMELRRVGATVQVHLHEGPPENSCRPAVDVLFRSVASLYGPATLGVVLTGMGQDGLRGCELIREQHGVVLAQDAASSVVWGMPGAVAHAGLATKILPLDQVGGEIVRQLRGAAPGKLNPLTRN